MVSRSANGQLEVYQLPAMRLVFSSGGLAEGQPVLGPAAAAADGAAADGSGHGPSLPDVAPAAVAELRLEGFPEPAPPSASAAAGSQANGSGGNGQGGGGSPEAAGAAPHLLARLEDGTLVAYRAFSPHQVRQCCLLPSTRPNSSLKASDEQGRSHYNGFDVQGSGKDVH